MSLKKNVIANYIGQGWTALMGLVFMPVYIRYLGIESYGLIGIFAILQSWLMLLDMGLTPALSREMARFTGGGHSAQSIRDLLRSVECIGFCVAILTALGIWYGSVWLATDWLKAEKLPITVVARAFTVMGIVMALRFIENIYRSSLVGLQKQVTLNVITSVLATIRSLGAVAILIWVAPTIKAFFVWQGIISVVTVTIFVIILYRTLPVAQQRARFSWTALTNIWRFAVGIMTITLLSFLLMQTDKILLSRLLTLEHFGYYALAAMVTSSLYMLVTPIDQAFFPRFTSLTSQGNQSSLKANYHLGSQLITVFVGAPAIILIVFGDIFLTVWTQDAVLAESIAPLLSVMSLGTLLNCFMHMPYQLQLAHGWTRLTIYINAIAVLILVPAIFWAAPKYGAIGVAWIWVILNASYIFLGNHFMFRRLLTKEKWSWYIDDISIPIIVAAGTATLIRWSIPKEDGALGVLVLLLASIVTLLVAALTASLVRQQLYRYSVKFVSHIAQGKN